MHNLPRPKFVFRKLCSVTFWAPRINCITNYDSKAKKLNTFCGAYFLFFEKGSTAFQNELFGFSAQFKS